MSLKTIIVGALLSLSLPIGGAHADKYLEYIQSQKAPSGLYAQYEGESNADAETQSLVAIALAQADPDKGKQVLDKIITKQDPDGSFPVEYDTQTGEVLESHGFTAFSTAWAVLAMNEFHSKDYADSTNRALGYLHDCIIDATEEKLFPGAVKPNKTATPKM